MAADRYGITAAIMKSLHGVPASISDAVIDDRIEYWADMIERYTRQWFDSKYKTLEMLGMGVDTLFLPIPIVDNTNLEVYLNEDTNKLGATEFQLGTDKEFQLDRENPRVMLVGDVENSIYNVASRNNYVFDDLLIQKVKANFGYVEADGSTPRAITRALAKLVVLDLRAGATLWDGGGSGFPTGTSASVGAAKKETTDGHSIEYDMSFIAASAKFQDSIDSLIPDREAKAILDMYKSPIGVNFTGLY